MDYNNPKIQAYIDKYLNIISDEVYIEMAQHFPSQLKEICSLISLDIQLQMEEQENETCKDKL
jgi:hypothetical protein|tara:strand:- start:264 stop:452 length:189 start_codon:yes stop_codon:yes gene_type:complete